MSLKRWADPANEVGSMRALLPVVMVLIFIVVCAVSCNDHSISTPDSSTYQHSLGERPVGEKRCDTPCSQPPSPACVTSSSKKVFKSDGRCVDGRCLYDVEYNSPCTNCCYGADLNLSGNPVGGGPGYDRGVSASDATVVVSTAVDLIEALRLAKAGDIVFIDGDATIDLTGRQFIPIPGNVTVASNRGRGGSKGALLYCDSYAYPLFEARGENVRITGLRLKGPNPNAVDPEGRSLPHSGGVASAYINTEVDNSELWAWGTYAIELLPGASNAQIHHNSIHDTRRAGYGYGIVLDQAQAVVYGNEFDGCRHAIAGSGRVGTSYEAAYNVVGSRGTDHGFDMHGAPDFDKRHTKAVWRFNEGGGEIVHDSSIGLFHPLNRCRLEGMPLPESWVSTARGGALRFSGDAGHLDCGNDPSLVAPLGTLTFWVDFKRLSKSAELAAFFDKGAGNYLTVGLDSSGAVTIRIVKNGKVAVSLDTLDRIEDRQLHHLAFAQAGNGIAVYIDGAPAITRGQNGREWTEHIDLEALWLGGGLKGPFVGDIAEARIYDRALTAEEVARHYQGKADIAGDRIFIHHNTFEDQRHAAVVIRGLPAQNAIIERNWFWQDAASAIRQENAVGNILVRDNHYGRPGNGQ